MSLKQMYRHICDAVAAEKLASKIVKPYRSAKLKELWNRPENPSEKP